MRDIVARLPPRCVWKSPQVVIFRGFIGFYCAYQKALAFYRRYVNTFSDPLKWRLSPVSIKKSLRWVYISLRAYQSNNDSLLLFSLTLSFFYTCLASSCLPCLSIYLFCITTHKLQTYNAKFYSTNTHAHKYLQHACSHPLSLSPTEFMTLWRSWSPSCAIASHATVKQSNQNAISLHKKYIIFWLCDCKQVNRIWVHSELTNVTHM